VITQKTIDLYRATRDLMGEPDFSDWLEREQPTEEQVRAKRHELATQAGMRNTRDKSEAIRIETGRLSWPPKEEVGSRRWWQCQPMIDPETGEEVHD